MCIFVRQRHRSTATKAPINQRHATGKRVSVGTHNLWRGLELWSGRRHRAFKSRRFLRRQHLQTIPPRC